MTKRPILLSAAAIGLALALSGCIDQQPSPYYGGGGSQQYYPPQQQQYYPPQQGYYPPQQQPYYPPPGCDRRYYDCTPRR